MHRIPDLAERFIYVQDDMLFGRSTDKADFFDPGSGAPIHVYHRIYYPEGHIPRAVTKTCIERAWQQHSGVFREAVERPCRIAVRQLVRPFDRFLKSRRALALIATISVSRYKKRGNFGC